MSEIEKKKNLKEKVRLWAELNMCINQGLK
jgi:hypothetical protein